MVQVYSSALHMIKARGSYDITTLHVITSELALRPQLCTGYDRIYGAQYIRTKQGIHPAN